jgi:hypothetical protein
METLFKKKQQQKNKTKTSGNRMYRFLHSTSNDFAVLALWVQKPSGKSMLQISVQT